MLAMIDLTAPQATRVLEQALRQHASVELDIRPAVWSGPPIRGSVVGRENALLRIKPEPALGGDAALLAGAFCDGQVILSGQLYQFTTCIIDASAGATGELLIASPQAIQTVNRRRFVRKSPGEPVTVQLFPSDSEVAYSASLVDIAPTGVAVRGHRGDLDDVLFVGDPSRMLFELPGLNEVFELRAAICNKTLETDRQHILVGLEFVEHGATGDELARLTRLRAFLNDPTLGFVETDGGR